MRLSISYSPLAAYQLQELKQRAEKSPHTRHQKLYEGLVQILAALELEFAATRNDNRLTHDLSVVWRDKYGRWRIFYLVSKDRSSLIVLALLEGRKAGDKNDPYNVIRGLIRRGKFDSQFDELGIAKPKL